MKKEHKQSISKLVQQICQKSKHRTRPKQVLDDLIQIMFNLLTEPEFQKEGNKFGEYWLDQDLRQELSTYKNEPEAWELLQEAVEVWLLMIAVNEPFTDIFGSLYDEYLGEALGQFLTPSDVALALAQILYEVKPIVQEDKKVSIADPCGCGAGTLLLAQLQVMLKDKGKTAMRQVHVYGLDLDAKMVQLTTVQIVMSAMVHKIPLDCVEVHHGNAIIDYNKPDKTLKFYWSATSKERERQAQERALEELMKRFCDYHTEECLEEEKGVIEIGVNKKEELAIN